MKHAKEVACQQSSTSTRASLTPELVVDMSFAPRAGEARTAQGESFGNWLRETDCGRFWNQKQQQTLARCQRLQQSPGFGCVMCVDEFSQASRTCVALQLQSHFGLLCYGLKCEQAADQALQRIQSKPIARMNYRMFDRFDPMSFSMVNLRNLGFVVLMLWSRSFGIAQP
eukprot:g9597.t1